MNLERTKCSLGDVMLDVEVACGQWVWCIMSEVQVFVEWGFGKIIQYFAYLDFRKNLKVLLQPVAKYYAVGAL